MANCPGLLELVILLVSIIPRIIFWRKTRVTIVAQNDGTSGLCVLTQNESGNKINLKITTPEEKEYWEIRFNPITINGVDTNAFFFILPPILVTKMDLWLMVTDIRIG